MAIGKKTGGRTKGIKNKSTTDFNNTVAESAQSTKDQVDVHCPGFMPVVFLCKIAMDEKNSIEVRLSAAKEAAKYLSPQLKAIETKDVTPQEKVYRVIYDDGGNHTPETTSP